MKTFEDIQNIITSELEKINWSKDLLSKVFKSKEQMLELESKISLNYDIIE